MKKKFIVIFSLLMLSSFSIAYANDSIKAVLYPVSYEINNKKQEIQEGYVTLKYNNRAYVPIRFIAENLGARVDYDDENKMIMINDSNVFTPSTLNDGDIVVGMEVARKDLVETDGISLGTVQFRGATLIQGTFMYAKNDEMSGELLLFTADPSSANKLPKMSHDRRDPIFVFSNVEKAKKLFGISDDVKSLTGKAVVEIDHFVINYQEKDIYNTAQLNEVYLHKN